MTLTRDKPEGQNRWRKSLDLSRRSSNFNSQQKLNRAFTHPRLAATFVLAVLLISSDSNLDLLLKQHLGLLVSDRR